MTIAMHPSSTDKKTTNEQDFPISSKKYHEVGLYGIPKTSTPPDLDKRKTSPLVSQTMANPCNLTLHSPFI